MLLRRASLALLFAIAALGQAQTPPPDGGLTKEQKAVVLKELEDIITQRAFVPGLDLTKWPEFIAKQQESLDKADRDNDFSRAINAALRDFGISHIRFITRRAAAVRNRTSVIGVGLNARLTNDTLVVTTVFPDSPAATAGIKQGDVILQVDGRTPDSNAVLMGEEGTEVTLKIKNSEGAEKEMKIKRAPYSVARKDFLSWQGEDAAILKVHSFSRGYVRADIEKLMKEASKAKYLVLDLRSNGGGATNNLQHLLSLFLPADATIGTFVSRRTAEQYASVNEGKVETDPIRIAMGSPNKYKTRKLEIEPFQGKVAVLINRGSASASEICAAALREHLKSPIIGSRSAGAVLASVFRRLPHGFEIQYPVSDYVSRDGLRLEKNPLEPDIESSARPDDGKDEAVEKALERLKGS